ncbi:MAG: epoxyqueuosine reductase QueH [Rickettsiales bacterium]|jgi:predicted adenine nucleotide alpha hydrolase (AANH) superfamily ATPase|nr:epoxyqueuosine reductase QueH [Rickettsiales bacterium]
MSENKRICLMSCCAPCSAGAITELKEQGVDFIVLFYNPNIYPEDEYKKRLDEQIKFCESVGAKYHILEYNHDDWLCVVRGHESAPERGARCEKCFAFRFFRAQKFALENGYTHIASVFGVSRHKSQNQVDTAAASVLTKIKYLPVKWDESLRAKTNKESNFYRQNYCGCEFSISRE